MTEDPLDRTFHAQLERLRDAWRDLGRAVLDAWPELLVRLVVTAALVVAGYFAGRAIFL